MENNSCSNAYYCTIYVLPADMIDTSAKIWVSDMWQPTVSSTRTSNVHYIWSWSNQVGVSTQFLSAICPGLGHLYLDLQLFGTGVIQHCAFGYNLQTQALGFGWRWANYVHAVQHPVLTRVLYFWVLCFCISTSFDLARTCKHGGCLVRWLAMKTTFLSVLCPPLAHFHLSLPAWVDNCPRTLYLATTFSFF